MVVPQLARAMLRRTCLFSGQVSHEFFLRTRSLSYTGEDVHSAKWRNWDHLSPALPHGSSMGVIPAGWGTDETVTWPGGCKLQGVLAFRAGGLAACTRHHATSP